ncbi:ethanolamine utilization microcompartment protein EutL [candidate division CSSED10-310 bacterium]|uniref:Ethanolamine utilization microcompartment protein EutL n=1 Tax=candidate division CSSED10-310 bacterium TaxID=2855610 RepID=A0ABV6YV12_UNCC1
MSVLDPIRSKVLAVRLISAINRDFAEKLDLKAEHNSLGLLTCDNDDACYVSIDEATKKAQVDVVYAQSFYAGSAFPSGPLSGEIIAMLAGPSPGEVQAGLEAAIDYIENEAIWFSANPDNTLIFFPHLIPRTGNYLSAMAEIEPGDPLSYLVAPPLEGTYAIDAALKAAQVKLVKYFAPPTETNFTGALLTGSQSACKAACDAFQNAVIDVSEQPIMFR